MSNLKTKKGITLIALVITIIVMIILVAVTVTLALNGGLFNYAKKASKGTNTSVAMEQKYVDLKEGQTYEDLIEKYTQEQDIHVWTRKGDTFTCSHCNASYTIGEVVAYAPNTNITQTVVTHANGKYEVQQQQPPQQQQQQQQQQQLQPQQQTIQAEQLTWVVLGLDKNGTLLITTRNANTITKWNARFRRSRGIYIWAKCNEQGV